MLVEVKIGALIMDPNSNTPVVILKGVDSEAVLPIWVGAYEANAIAVEIEKVTPQRPMTHDLLKNLILQLGYSVERVIVNDLKDNTFYAIIELVNDESGEKVQIDSRPSDAIALALRMDSPIYVDQRVLELSASNVTTAEEEKGEEEWPDVIG
ncbi:MAG: bifunctional nuclease family protein [Pyrinomonadaceae bacterium]|nr:bifunctional nuclease family protein [Pyrinomonadaceae bacterium]MCX7640995.1 bifunctional nuclease family protein [Pyrinomonadaceae bacterium]MDW8305081.1 bifunctional nuclease family protein [Acidobacteriota bacterium]